MQTVLSIDATDTPAEAVLVEIDKTTIRVLERHTIDISFKEPFSSPPSDTSKASATAEAPIDSSSSEQPMPVETASPEPPPTGDSDWVLTDTAIATHTNGAATHDKISALLSAIKAEWTSSILFVPSSYYISLTVTLPFADPKNVAKVLPHEVQDLVPFNIDDFHLQHRTLGQRPDGSYNIHVGLIPKEYVRGVLSTCHSGDLEPYIIATTASAFEALVHLKPDVIQPDSLVMLARGTKYEIGIFQGGKLVGDRSFEEEAYLGSPRETMLAQLRILLKAAEEKFQLVSPPLYVLGDGLDVEYLSRSLQRTVSQIALSDVIAAASKNDDIAVLGALFAQDYPAPSILTNFRTKEFAYSPRLKELSKGFKTLMPYLFGFLLLSVVTMAALYGLRAWKIASFRSEMRRQIYKVLPTIKLTDGNELNEVQGEINALDDLMKDLVSPSTTSLLDLLLAVSEALPKSDGIETRRVTIKPSKISIEGTAPDFASVERVEKALKQKKGVCWKVDAPSSRSSSMREGGREFSIDIRLCD